jgi:hypothetical protein
MDARLLINNGIQMVVAASPLFKVDKSSITMAKHLRSMAKTFSIRAGSVDSSM